MLLYLSFHYDICGKKNGRDQWYLVVLAIFILIAGLRYRTGIDTISYVNKFYHVYPGFNEFSLSNFTIGDDLLYILLNSIVKSFGGRFYVVQLLVATFVNTLIFSYFRKHSTYLFTCLLFYFILCYIHLCFEIMRGSMSIVVCLYANEYIIEKKYIKAYLLYLCAFLFHAQTIVLFFTPLLFFMRFDKKSMFLILFVTILGYVIQSKFGYFFDLLEISSSGSTLANKAEHVSDTNMDYAQKRNIFFYVFNYIPYLLSIVLSVYYIKKKKSSNSLLKLEPLVLIGLMFYCLHTALYIIYRHVDYYKIYFVLYFAECFVGMATKTHRIKFSLALSRSLLLFIPILLMSAVELINSGKYYPYSSVVERSIYPEKEKVLKNIRSTTEFFPPRPDEY